MATATATPTSAEDATPDPFDPANLRLPQDFGDTGVRKMLTTVPVRKPGRHDWIRVRPESNYRLQTCLIQFGDDRDFYLVPPASTAFMAGEFHVFMIYTAINRQGVVFLWPVRLPDSDGRQIEWHRSAHEAAAKATEQWIRLASNRSLGAYEILIAQGQIPEPVWPDHSLRDLLKIAFSDRIIDKPDHEVIRQLRGLP
jgi:hypothetical protein